MNKAKLISQIDKGVEFEYFFFLDYREKVSGVLVGKSDEIPKVCLKV